MFIPAADLGMMVIMEYIVVLLLASAILAAILRKRFDFNIHCSREEVTLQGKIPKSRHSEIKDFFVREFQNSEKITIFGKIKNEGQLVLKIRGNVSPGKRQQIRNFLLALL